MTSIDSTLTNMYTVEDPTKIEASALLGLPDRTGFSFMELKPYIAEAAVTTGKQINEHYQEQVADSDQVYLHITLCEELPGSIKVPSEYSGLLVYASAEK